jgi:hypothetical protein
VENIQDKSDKSAQLNSNSEPIVNTIAIRTYGLMRSGNHAVINWIQNQYPGQSICFLNNVKPGPCDPYHNFVQIELSNIPDDLPIENLRHTSKHLLIYSYEDRASLAEENGSLLDTILNPANQQTISDYLLGCRHCFTLGILRDPYNCLASRMALIRMRGKLGGLSNMELIKDNWKQIARLAISLQSQPENDHTIILYNKWLESKAYRKEISHKIKGSYADNSLDSIPIYGGGSSFTLKQRLPLRATIRDASRKWKKVMKNPSAVLSLSSFLKSRMVPLLDANQLNSRWQNLANDDEYRELFRDKELIDLSRELFGSMKNEQSFLNSL